VTTTVSRRTSATSPGDDRGRTRITPVRIALAALLALVLLAAAVWVVAFSPVLGARTVTVRGERAVSAQQILAAADIPHGTPLVRLDTAAVTARIERLDGVYSARVSTSYPSTVVISVVERSPVGVVRRGGGYVLVDRTGAQYRTVSGAPAHLPVFVLPDDASARAAGRALATVAAALPASVRARIRSMQASVPAAVTLLTTGGKTVRWGSAARSADKARILPTLLRTHASVVDVSDPVRPFTH
jgi:cell division protein FtsQ